MKTKFKWFVTLFACIVFGTSYGQKTKISGNVSDESGGLPGVTVTVRGGNVGASTDFDGAFSISAKVGDVLIFSYLGYETQEVAVESEEDINVVLVEGSNQLDEVIVSGVAGGTSRKKLSVSVAKIGSEEITNAPAANAAGALQGKVAGVTVTTNGQPGSGANIILRGAKNLFGSQSPLTIIDGVLVENGLADINVNDIESYEVVKGASASALYGSRAGNGVIVITTKRGRGLKGPQITLRSELGFRDIERSIDINQSHHYKLADDYQSVAGIYTKYDGVTYPDGYQGGYSQDIAGGRLEEDDLYSDNPYGAYFNPQEEFFNTGFNQSLFVSASNSGEYTNTYFSFEEAKDKGILAETDGFKRRNIRANIDFKFNDWLSLTTSNLFTSTVNNTPGGGAGVFYDIYFTTPDTNLNLPNPDGQPYMYVPNPWEENNTNPLYDLYKNQREGKDNRFLGAYNLKIRLGDHFSWENEYAFDSSNFIYTSYNPKDTYTTSGTGPIYSNGSLFKSTNLSVGQKFQSTLNFTKAWENLIVKGKLSALFEDNHFESFAAQGIDLKYDGIQSLDNFDVDQVTATSSIQDDRAQNYFAILGIDFKDRYILDGMFRRDGSSLFGENNKWANYYRISGAYRISEDLKLKNVNELKLRAAIGTAGQRPGYSWQYEFVPMSNGQLSSDRFASNPDLKPSMTTEYEFGIEGLIANRLSFEVVYSKSVTENSFMLVPLLAPANDGKNRQWQNVGTVDFSIWEATVGLNLFGKGNFSWDMNFNFTTQSNTIKELFVPDRQVGPSDMFLITEGGQFGDFYGREFVTTLDQMEAQLPAGESIGDYSVNSDGLVVKTADIGTSAEAPTVLVDENGIAQNNKIGNQLADWTMGWNNTLRLKDFTLTFLWDYSHGGDMYNAQMQYLGRDNLHPAVDQAGKPEDQKKTVTYYQTLYDVNQVNGYWVEDRTFLKLREVSFYYDVNSRALDKFANGFFSGIRMGVNGRNLLTISDYSGLDPEALFYDGETQQYFSYDYNVYPNSRSVNFSLQLKF